MANKSLGAAVLSRRQTSTGRAPALGRSSEDCAEITKGMSAPEPNAGNPATRVKSGGRLFPAADEGAEVQAIADRIASHDPQKPGRKDSSRTVFVDHHFDERYIGLEGLYISPNQGALKIEREQSPAAAAPLSVQPSLDEPVVFVINDDASIRESLASLLVRAGWHARSFASANEFLSYPRLTKPNCLVLDVALADINGLELQKQLANRSELPLIFVTDHRDIALTVRAMKAGALEFLTRPFSDEALLGAVDLALDRSQEALKKAADARALSQRYASLSPREREVMTWVATGLLNKQIAGELRLSLPTVKTHRTHVMRKMGARSLAELVRMELRLGPVAGPECSVAAVNGWSEPCAEAPIRRSPPQAGE